MKKIVALLLMLCMIVSLLPMTALADAVDTPAVEETFVACTATEGCTLAAGHEGDCVLTESTTAPCTATEGCTLAAGHEGDCVLTESTAGPCTVTEGCTLTEGHEGACSVASNTAELEPDPVEKVQAMIDALPETDAVTEENSAEFVAQLAAIDLAIKELSEEQQAALDLEKYQALVNKLSSMPKTLEVTGAFKIGDESYATLGDAVAAVSADGSQVTITFTESTVGGGVVVAAGKNIVFDLNNTVYSVGAPTVGSTGTETNGFQLLKGATVTIKNGTVKANNYINLKTLIQNYSNLTLDNVTLDATEDPNCGYVVGNNCGAMNLVGATNISAYPGKVAFDAYYWPSNGYTEGVKINVNTSGTVSGRIEYGCDGSAASADIAEKAKLNIQSGNIQGNIYTYSLHGTEPGIEVTGGTFSEDVSAYVPDGLMAKDNGGAFVVQPATDPVEGAVAEVNGIYYKDLANAFEKAASGDVIKLVSEVTLAETISVADKSVILDLNGNTVSMPSLNADGVNAALTIKDSTPDAQGKLKVTDKVGAYNGAQVTMESGNLESANLGLCAIGDTTGAAAVTSTATMTGGYVLAQEFAISPQGNGATVNFIGGVAESRDNAVIAGNGSAGRGGTTINISGGKLIGHIKTPGYSSCGVYHPQEGVLNISGGEIYSENGCGVLMRGGTLNMTGGTINAEGAADAVGKVGDSSVVVPTSGVVLDRDAGYYDGVNSQIAISGSASVSGTNSAVTVLNTNTADVANKVLVSGGTFSSDVSEYVVPGNAAIPNGDGTYSIGVAPDAVAKVGDTGYASLQEAINAAAGGEVKLLKDVAENVIVPAGANVTLDLNGNTINGGTVSGKAALTNNGKLTIKDSVGGGTIRRDDTGAKAYYVVDNQGTMNIEGGSFCNNSGDSGSGASLIRNAGAGKAATLNISGGTFTQDNFIAIKNDDLGVLNITGGEVNSAKESAVQNWSEANITGGTINGAVYTSVWSADYAPAETNIGGDANVNGRIIVVKYSPSLNVTPETNITGGNLDVEFIVEDDGSKAVVSGGTFTKPVPEEYCAPDFVPVQNGPNSFGVAPQGDCTVTLSYDANGGKDAPAAESKIVAAGTKASFTVSSVKPTKSGYTIIGWSTTEKGAVEYKAGETVETEYSITLYAVWEELPDVTLTITYDANGGVNAPAAESTTVKMGSDASFTVPSVEPTRSGYAFKGWSTSATGAVEYSAGETVSTAKDVTLYAVWNPVEILTLHFDANGGRRAPADQRVETDTGSGIIVIQAGSPHRLGYYFQGWSTSPNGSVKYRPGDGITITKDTTLYAVWQGRTDAPKTGDTSNIALWATLATLSVVAAGAAVVILKKKGKNE